MEVSQNGHKVPNVGLLAEECQQLQTEAKNINWNDSLDDATYFRLNTIFNKLNNWNRHTPVDLAFQLITNDKIRCHLDVARRLRAFWEYEYEKREALRIISSATPHVEMNKLLASQLAITTLHGEWLQHRSQSDWNTCLLIGSGPLPTTVALLHKLSNLTVTCIDREAESCQIANELNTAIGGSPTQFIVTDAISYNKIEQYDVIMATVLTGVSWRENSPLERNELLQRLLGAVDRGASLLLRSAYGLGELFYPTLEPSVLIGYDVEFLEPPVLGRSALFTVNPLT